jgi:hypothetical protein
MYYRVTVPNKEFNTDDRCAPRYGVEFSRGVGFVEDTAVWRVSDKDGPTHFVEENVLAKLRDELGYTCEPIEPGEVLLAREAPEPPAARTRPLGGSRGD